MMVEVGESTILIAYDAIRNNCVNRAGFAGGSNSRVGWSFITKTTNKFSPGVRERAVRMETSKYR